MTRTQLTIPGLNATVEALTDVRKTYLLMGATEAHIQALRDVRAAAKKRQPLEYGNLLRIIANEILESAAICDALMAEEPGDVTPDRL
jgi:hypothetical protein